MPHKAASEIHVLSASEFKIETKAKLQQRCRLSPKMDVPSRGANRARDDLQQGALASSVGANHRNRFACEHPETHTLQCPKNGARRDSKAYPRERPRGQAAVRCIRLCDFFDDQDGFTSFAHSASTRSALARRKSANEIITQTNAITAGHSSASQLGQLLRSTARW